MPQWQAENRSINKLCQSGQNVTGPGRWMHTEAFVVQAYMCLLVGDGEPSCVRSPPRETINSALPPWAKADPHFVPLLLKRWCVLLSCGSGGAGGAPGEGPWWRQTPRAVPATLSLTGLLTGHKASACVRDGFNV